MNDPIIQALWTLGAEIVLMFILLFTVK